MIPTEYIRGMRPFAFLLLIGCGHAKFEDDASMQPDATEMFDATDEMSISVGDASTDGDAGIQCPPPPPPPK